MKEVDGIGGSMCEREGLYRNWRGLAWRISRIRAEDCQTRLGRWVDMQLVISAGRDRRRKEMTVTAI